MPCLTPIVLKNVKSTAKNPQFTNIFPCGKCPDCIKRRAAAWAFRLTQQQKISHSSAFITYTYTDEEILFSENGLHSLCKKDHQLFMKRLRKKINATNPLQTDPQQLSYYAVGEYGSKTHRPHMHSIMFNLPDVFLNEDYLGTIWGHGRVQVDKCEPASIAYVTQYINKKTTHTDDPDDDRQPEFSLISKGIGKNYLSPAIRAYYKKNQIPYLVTEGGLKKSMPQYYKNNLYTESERKKLQISQLEFLESQDDKFTSEQHHMDWKKMKFYTHNKDLITRQKL